MIKFNLPGLYTKRHITLNFLEYCTHYLDHMNENMGIGAVYDSIPYCIWNGGRVFANYTQATKPEIIQLKQTFNDKFHIPMRLIYTNAYLEPKHLGDRFCNLTLELLNDPQNEIVVASPLLEEYIRTNYPDYKIISSTTKCITNTQESIAEINKNYYQICLDYNLNHNFEFLKSIPEEDKPKIEFLCNAICPSGCPNRKKHYYYNALATLAYQNNFNIECGIHGNTFNNYPNNIRIDEIKNTYEPMGFQNFKLEGRTLTDNEVLANYVSYLIKPEYQLHCMAMVS